MLSWFVFDERNCNRGVRMVREKIQHLRKSRGHLHKRFKKYLWEWPRYAICASVLYYPFYSQSDKGVYLYTFNYYTFDVFEDVHSVIKFLPITRLLFLATKKNAILNHPTVFILQLLFIFPRVLLKMLQRLYKFLTYYSIWYFRNLR
jgi:hypothetical protein